MSKIVTISELNPVVAISGPITICQKETATLIASGANTYSWNTGAGSNSIIVMPQFQFTYNVVGTTTNNCAASKTFTVNVNLCTNLNEIDLKNNFQIFPNPSSDILQIRFETGNSSLNQNLILKIVDVFGRELENQKIQQNETLQLSTIQYSEGIYFISFYNQTKLIETKKLIISRQ
jgi:hypothetical protein